MQISPAQLEQAAKLGSEKVAQAFTRLSGAEVRVATSLSETVQMKEVQERVRGQVEQPIVVYSQFLNIEPTPGVAILTLEREDALALVDLLNKQAIGTTGILKDIDRSALKETLNILSNSYMNGLADSMQMEVGLGVPNMITADRLMGLVEGVVEVEGEAQVVLFETKVTVNEYNISATLFVIFNKELAEKAR